MLTVCNIVPNIVPNITWSCILWSAMDMLLLILVSRYLGPHFEPWYELVRCRLNSHSCVVILCGWWRWCHCRQRLRLVMFCFHLFIKNADVHICHVIEYVEYDKWYREQCPRDEVYFTNTVHLVFMSLEFISVAYVTQKTVHKLHQTILLFHPLLNRWCRRLQKTKSVKVKKHDVILEIVSERLPWTLEISSIGFNYGICRGRQIW